MDRHACTNIPNGPCSRVSVRRRYKSPAPLLPRATFERALLLLGTAERNGGLV